MQDELGTQFHTMHPMCIRSSGNRAPSLHRLPRKDLSSFLACRCRQTSLIRFIHPVAPPAADKWVHTAELGGLRPRRERGPNQAQQATSPSTEKRARPPPACSVLGLRLRLRLPRLIGLLALGSQDQESNPSCNVGAEINLQDLRACNLSIYIYIRGLWV